MLPSYLVRISLKTKIKKRKNKIRRRRTLARFHDGGAVWREARVSATFHDLSSLVHYLPRYQCTSANSRRRARVALRNRLFAIGYNRQPPFEFDRERNEEREWEGVAD